MTDAVRPANLLDEETMARCPVWRFIRPGESSDPEADESYVRRCTQPPGVGEYASYLVRATYDFDSGLRLPGTVQVDVLDKTVEFTPSAVFAGTKSVDPIGRGASQRLERILKMKVSPARRWTLDVILQGEAQPRSYALSGSPWLEALGLIARLARLRALG